MANQPKTPITSFRIPVGLRERAQEKARAEGRTLTDVVIELLEGYSSDT